MLRLHNFGKVAAVQELGLQKKTAFIDPFKINAGIFAKTYPGKTLSRANYMMPPAAIGAGLGAASAGEDNRLQGAALGALGGLAGGIGGETAVVNLMKNRAVKDVAGPMSAMYLGGSAAGGVAGGLASRKKKPDAL